MKKIFTSAMLMMLGIIGMNAQVTVYSWESPKGNPIERGGTIAYVNGDGDRLNYPQAGYYTICLNGKKGNLNDETPSANAGKMVITLNQALQVGDKIDMTAFINKDASKESSPYFVFENGTTLEGEIFGDESNVHENFGAQPTTKTMIVPEAAAGSKTITMTRSKAGTNLFITKLAVTSKSDYTNSIVNADLTGEGGFDATGTKGIDGSGIVKCGNNAQFDFKQTIVNLPAGLYKLTAKAAYRYSGSEADEAAAIAEGTDTKLATLYATVGETTFSTKVMNRWDCASETDYANGDGSTMVNDKYVPNSSNAVKAWFNAGQYVNEVIFNLAEEGDVTIGIVKTAQPDAGDYTVIGPWTLTRIESATFDFSDPNFRNPVGTAMADVDGFIYNETFPVDDVTLQITGGSAPSRIYVDASRGQNLVTYKEYTTLTFRAPEGKAITKIEFVAAGNSNIKNFTASSGTIEDMTWTGNADGVRFIQGGTSYLAKAIVTVEASTAETAVLAPIEYVECANIAAFNALEAGTYAKVMLTDAEITGVSADGYSTVWIQDATSGCWIQYTSLNAKLVEKTKLNGFVYTVKRVASGNPQMKEAEGTLQSEFTAEPIADYTIISGSIDEVNVAANLNKVVKIINANLEETSATAGKLTQDESSIDVTNGNETANQQLHKIAEWAKDTKLEGIDMVAILVAKSATANQLLPISIEATTTGISTISVDSNEVNIFNLQGQRLNSVQKGLYIINGKKMMVN